MLVMPLPDVVPQRRGMQLVRGLPITQSTCSRRRRSCQGRRRRAATWQPCLPPGCTTRCMPAAPPSPPARCGEATVRKLPHPSTGHVSEPGHVQAIHCAACRLIQQVLLLVWVIHLVQALHAILATHLWRLCARPSYSDVVHARCTCETSGKVGDTLLYLEPRPRRQAMMRYVAKTSVVLCLYLCFVCSNSAALTIVLQGVEASRLLGQ